MSDQLYRIRPLAWERKRPDWYLARSALGEFRILYGNGPWGDLWSAYCGTQMIGNRFNTLEAAQLAAEQWHRERLAADLEPVNDLKQKGI